MDVAELSTAEHEALRKVFDRDHDGAFDFQAFVTRARRDAIMGCIMVPWCGMWLGVEPDGYTHS